MGEVAPTSGRNYWLPRRHRFVDLLRLPGFLRLLAVRWPSQAGDGLFQLGAAWLLLFSLSPTEATSGAQLAWVLAVTTLPFSFVGPFAGVVIDRWRRQRILVWTNIVRIVVIAVALPFAYAGILGQVVFLAAVVTVLSMNRFFLATIGAVLPKVVPGQELTPANAVATIGGSIASLLGAALGGVVAGFVGENRGGPEVAILLALAAFVISVIVASRLPVEVLGPDRRGDLPPLRHELSRTFGELVDGVRRIGQTRRAWAPIITLMILRFLTAVAALTTLLVFRNLYLAGPSEIGILLVLFGVGAFLGAAGVSLAERHFGTRPESAIRATLVFGGLTTMAFAPGLRQWALLAMSLFSGVAFATAKIPADALVQSALPDRYRGRVFAVYDVLYNLGFLTGGIVTAATVPTAQTAEPALIASGLASVLIAVLARPWLARMPPPVDVDTWEESQQVLDRSAS
ncbi:MAG: MFS transporter [Actinomycetota bacterium]|nr:MFS transporter [Actinomycetota bacterium]